MTVSRVSTFARAPGTEELVEVPVTAEAATAVVWRGRSPREE